MCKPTNFETALTGFFEKKHENPKHTTIQRSFFCHKLCFVKATIFLWVQNSEREPLDTFQLDVVLTHVRTQFLPSLLADKNFHRALKGQFTPNLCRPKTKPAVWTYNDCYDHPKTNDVGLCSEHYFPSQRGVISQFSKQQWGCFVIWISLVMGKTSDAVNGCSRDTWKDMDTRAIICLKRSGGPENLPWTW